MAVSQRGRRLGVIANATNPAMHRLPGRESVCARTTIEGGFMTTTAERTQGPEAPEREGEEQLLHPLLLATLMRRRGEEDEPLVEHPLLLAALMHRRKERGTSIIQHPLL